MVLTRSDIVAWYELQREEESGVTYDEHAQNDGTINGATLSTDAPSSNSLGSFDFDGSNDYIDINDSDFDQNNFTISAWIKFDTSHFGEIVSYADRSLNQQYIRVGVTSDNKFLFRENDDVSNREYRTTNTFSTGTWYHVVFTKDTDFTNVKIYVNGSEEALTTTISGNPSVSGLDNLDIGRLGRSSSADYFNGHISSLQILNKPANSTEVSTLYNSGDVITYRELFALSDDLEAYYKLDGDSNDASGNGNDGTVNGATSGSQGVIGTAYDFDGTNDYIAGTNINITDSITVELWVKPDGTSASIYAAKRASGGYSWEIGSLSTDAFFRINSNSRIARSSGGLTTDEWNHVVGTYDGSTIKVFINGVLEDTFSYSSSINSNTVPIDIGRRGLTGSGAYFDGTIDEVAIWSRALPDGEVRRRYSFGAGLRYEDLDSTDPLVDRVIAAYNFNGDVLDAKNNTYDATNNGTTDVAGIVDRGRSFDGTNDYIDIPSFELESFSVGLWFNTSDTGGRNALAGQWGTTGSDRRWLMRIDNEDAEFYIRTTGGSSIFISDTSQSWADSNWNMMGASYDSGDTELYMNGTLSDSGSPGTINSSSEQIRLGESHGNFLTGSQDIVTFFAGKMSLTEWNAFYNAGNGTEFILPPEVEEQATANALFFGGGI